MCVGQYYGAVIPNYNENCNSYYVCNNDIPKKVMCTTGLFFNIEAGYCNLVDNVMCTEPSLTIAATTIIAEATTEKAAAAAATTIKSAVANHNNNKMQQQSAAIPILKY